MREKEPRPIHEPIKKLRIILEGKAQKAFLDNPTLLSNYKLVLKELDSAASIEQLQIVARANGIEVTKEELDFANGI